MALAWGDPGWRDQTTSPAAFHPSAEVFPVDRIAVANQEAQILVVPIRDRFDKALRRILPTRRGCHPDVQDLPVGQVDDDEAVQDLESQGDDGEEVARPGLMEMVAKKRGPTLTTVARQVRRSVLGDSPWRYLVAQLSKLPGDSVLAPQRVLRPELANQGP
jgi:hypothetical protein